MSTYYATIGNQVEGPFSDSDLLKMAAVGRIGNETLVTEAEGEAAWRPFRDVRAGLVSSLLPELEPEEGFFEVKQGAATNGPFSYADLKRMAGSNRIDGRTHVRRIPSQTWQLWCDLEAAPKRSPQPQSFDAPPAWQRSDKSRGVFIILGLTLGGMGAHNFYAGNYGRAVAQLIASLVGLGVFAATGCPLSVLVVGWVFYELFTTKCDSEGAEFRR
jgi:TM2 domain-containing membrane protein YozV